MSTKTQYVGVTSSPAGVKIQNFALQTYVDTGDGTGQQLVTVMIQGVACNPVDGNGNLIEPDEVYLTADWKRQLLDEMRAIRIGIQMMVENRRDIPDSDQSLLDQAQEMREAALTEEDQFAGPQAPGIGVT